MAEWALSSAVLAAVLILLRRLLRGRISPLLQYSLWLILLLRLLIPVNLFESRISVANVLPPESPQQNVVTVTVPGWEPTSFEQKEQAQEYVESYGQIPRRFSYNTSEKMAHFGQELTMRLVWFAGMLCLLALAFISNLCFAFRLKSGRRKLPGIWLGKPSKLYISSGIVSPCLFGLFFPAIYVTEELAVNDVSLGHVLAHERAHYRHGDQLWGLLRVLALALHWYNPLIWWAAALSKRDAEAAADASAISQLGEKERRSYGETLIRLVQRKAKPPELLYCSTAMFGSKAALKERIKLIAKRPSTAVKALVALSFVSLAAALCTFTGASAAPVSAAPSLSPEIAPSASPALPDDSPAPTVPVYSNSELLSLFTLSTADMNPYTGPSGEQINMPRKSRILASDELENGLAVFLYADGSRLYAACNTGDVVLRYGPLTDQWQTDYTPILQPFQDILACDGFVFGFRADPLSRAQLFLFTADKEGLRCIAEVNEGYRAEDLNFDGVKEILSYQGGDINNAPSAVYYCLYKGEPRRMTLSGLLLSQTGRFDIQTSFDTRSPNPYVQPFQLFKSNKETLCSGEFRFSSRGISCYVDELYLVDLAASILDNAPIIYNEQEYYFSGPIFKVTSCSLLGEISSDGEISCSNSALSGVPVYLLKDSEEDQLVVRYNDIYYLFRAGA